MNQEQENTCPRCGSSHVVKAGRAKEQQRFLCRKCGCKFREQSARMRRFPPEVIGRAIELFYEGMSLRKTAETIGREYGDPHSGIAHRTVELWVKGYVETASTALVDLKARTGVRWVVYAVALKYGPRWWLVKDDETGYILGSHVNWRGREANARSVIEKALTKASRPCEHLAYRSVVDGDSWEPHDLFDESTLDEFRSALKGCSPSCDIGVADSMTVDHREERFVQIVKSMVRKYRWYKNAELLDIYLNGWTMVYNFFPGTLVDCEYPPGQNAQVDVPFQSWEDIVRLADRWESSGPNSKLQS